jgi:hypothetical protein
MNEVIYERLKSTARAGKTTNYGALAPLAGLNMGQAADRRAMGQILEEISVSENQAGRPMLSAVVVRADSGDPGSGFYSLARRIGKFPGGDARQFHAEELQRVHTFWKGRR